MDAYALSLFSAIHVMQPIVPFRAPVRPRVTTRESGDSRPLEDVFQELAEEEREGIVWIVGDSGSGKSTALAHLAAVFAEDDRFVFYDEPKPFGIGVHDVSQLVVATTATSAARNGIVLLLQPWGIDEFVEYLLAVYPKSCSSVMDRLGKEARQRWSPQVASIVLERFAHDLSLTDPTHALVAELHERFPKHKQFSAAAQVCLAMLLGGSEQIATAARLTAKTGCSPETLRLLRHSSIQLPLATECLMSALDSRRAYQVLTRRMPFELIELVGRACRDQPAVPKRIENVLESSRSSKAHPMAASILMQADPAWRPVPKRTGKWNLAGGYFPKAEWSVMDLSGALIWNCDFTEAKLTSAVLDRAVANGVAFDSCDLSDASLKQLRATAASFRSANLKGADFSQADLSRSDFTGAELSDCEMTKVNLSGADLTSAQAQRAMLAGVRLYKARLEDGDFSGANFYTADLSHTDLRRTKLGGACFVKANLSNAQLEDVFIANAIFSKARLIDAHLTGSQFPGADFQEADLSRAFLAEIEWEGANLRGADLRGATFHMGSSRSGLVGSPIAREGSMTGFYTDEREEMYFKRPEEIRKANLCGADLRGAKIDGVDFYLVDLRGAKFDQYDEKQLRSTGAILNSE